MAAIASILKQLIYSLAVAVYRLASLFVRNTNLHTARFARLHELTDLISTSLEPDTSLLLGASHLDHVLRVQPQSTRRELGNLLVAAPTRGGKGLLAVSQLLTWRHSVVVNDIKGDLFSRTAGFRRTLGPVFVFDPTGVGHRYDPLMSRSTEDELLSSATQRSLGRRSEYAHSQTQKEGTTVSQGLSEQGIPLLTAGEIKMMRDEDIIGFHRRLPPFQAKRMDWRRFPELARRQRISPPPPLSYLPVLTDTPFTARQLTERDYIDPDALAA